MQFAGVKFVKLLLIAVMIVAPIRTVSAISPATHSNTNQSAQQTDMPAHHNDHAIMNDDDPHMQNQTPVQTGHDGHDMCTHCNCSSGSSCDCSCSNCIHIDIGLISTFTLPTVHQSSIPPRVAFSISGIILSIDTHPPIS